MINIYDDMLTMLTDTDQEKLAELIAKMLLNTSYTSTILPQNSGSISGTIPMKKPVLKVETLNKSFKVKGVRYKRRINFTPYINRAGDKSEMIARSDEVREFIEDSCLRRYYLSYGNTYSFECKKDAALAYLKFA